MLNPLQMKDMLANAKQMGEEMQRKMEQTVVESSSGGGIVVEMLQDLVLAAVNEAGRKADEAMQSSVSGMLGGLDLPGLL